jgi:hypothetical protein
MFEHVAGHGAVVTKNNELAQVDIGGQAHAET